MSLFRNLLISKNQDITQREYSLDGLQFCFDGTKGLSSSQWVDTIGGKVIKPLRGTPLFDTENKYIRFDGDSTVNCSVNYSFTTSSQRTIELVLKVESQIPQIVFELKRYSNQGDGFWINVDNNEAIYHPYGVANTWNAVKIKTTDIIGKTITMTGVCNPLENKNTLIVNGIIVDSNDKIGTTAYQTSEFTVGGRATSYGYVGNVYSIRYYDKILTQEEITNNHIVDIAKYGITAI